MGQNYHDDQWKTWHEGPPRNDRRWLLLLGIGLALIFLLALCGAGYWFVLRPLLAQTTAVTAPPIPTLPGDGQPATAEALNTPPALSTATSTPAAESVAADFAAGRLAQPPTLDGSLDDWPAGPTIASAFQVYARAGWDGSADLQATWRVGWDANNLYVAVTIVDDLHVQTQTGNQMFRGDSVELQIDTNRAANAAQVNPSTFQLLLSPGNFADLPPSAFRFQGTGGGQILDAPGHGIQVGAARTGDGYALEATIPWRDLNYTPDQGDILGVALNANDNDRPGEAVQEVMMSSSAARTLTDPRTWGTMVLE